MCQGHRALLEHSPPIMCFPALKTLGTVSFLIIVSRSFLMNPLSIPVSCCKNVQQPPPPTNFLPVQMATHYHP